MLFDLMVGKLLAPGGAGWPGILKVLLAAAAAAAVVTTIFMEQVAFWSDPTWAVKRFVVCRWVVSRR